MFDGKPRTIGELYERIMVDKARQHELGRPTSNFYITQDYDEDWIEVTSTNLSKYKDLVPIKKYHDKWDEYVCFKVDLN